MYLQNIYNGGVLHEIFLFYCEVDKRKETRQKIMLETEQGEGEQRKIWKMWKVWFV